MACIALDGGSHLCARAVEVDRLGVDPGQVEACSGEIEACERGVVEPHHSRVPHREREGAQVVVAVAEHVEEVVERGRAERPAEGACGEAAVRRGRRGGGRCLLDERGQVGEVCERVRDPAVVVGDAGARRREGPHQSHAWAFDPAVAPSVESRDAG